MLAWYRQLVEDGTLCADDAQARAAAVLDDFATALQARTAAADADWKTQLRQWLGGEGSAPSAASADRGVYLHGGVGRGKSLLMDGFFLHLPLRRKLRVHFHQFMRRLHADMKANEDKHDPLVHVAEKIIADYDLICFDEFHVSDITDAMLLGRLLDLLLAAGVRFVMTSNYAPDGLYPNGLARDRFLPAIALLKRHLAIVALEGDEDYRRRLLADQATYFSPWEDAACQQAMQRAFDRLACGIALQKSFKLSGRAAPALARSSDCIWFDFATLCVQPRAKADYLQLAERFATLFVSAVPALNADDLSDAARRFTWLVDILYDANVRLVLGAAVELEQLYGGGEGGESGRTLSRLVEMQSSAYADTAAPTAAAAAGG